MTAPFFRIVRVQPDGSERVLREIPWMPVRGAQPERVEALADAKSRKGHIRVYSSADDGTVSPGDLIFDSTAGY